MKIYNCTGRHLTGADRRFLRRSYHRMFRRQRAWMVSYYGDEQGALMAKQIRQKQERTLVQQDGPLRFVANAVWSRQDTGGLVADGACWVKVTGDCLAWAPVVRL